MPTPAPLVGATDGRDPSGNRCPQTGQFLKGYKGGRKHRIDLLSVCDRMARNEGAQLEDLLWQVIKGLMHAAARGNVPAAKLLFDYMVKKDDQTNRVDARFAFSPDNGAPVPTNLEEWLTSMKDANNDLNDTGNLITLEEVQPEVIKDVTPRPDPEDELARFLQ